MLPGVRRHPVGTRSSWAAARARRSGTVSIVASSRGALRGWHICFKGPDRFLAGEQIGAIAGANAMKLNGWERLVGEYSKQFGTVRRNGPPKAAQRS
jgi:hypothetical protein